MPPGGDFRLATRDEQGFALVRMPFMDGSLQDWIGAAEPGTEERLAVLAQLCNGLNWLYERGISAHGDLKPENVLLQNVRCQGREGVPALQRIVKVADLGWADIWEDLEGLEFIRKAGRPYLAPERLEGKIRGAASDMFSFGVIAVELLAGVHPAGKPSRVVDKWKDSKYAKWARQGLRSIPGNLPMDIRALLEQCMVPRPEDRPRPQEVFDRICRTTSAELGYDLAALLQKFTGDARRLRDVPQRLSEIEEPARLGGPSLDQAIEELERKLTVQPLPRSSLAVAEWLGAGRSLTPLLLQRGSPEDRERAGEAARSMLRFVVDHFHDVDLRREFYEDPLRGELVISDLEPAEVMLEFGLHAKWILHEVGRAWETEISELGTKLEVLWQEAQPPLEEFLTTLILGKRDRRSSSDKSEDEPEP